MSFLHTRQHEIAFVPNRSSIWQMSTGDPICRHEKRMRRTPATHWMCRQIISLWSWTVVNGRRERERSSDFGSFVISVRQESDWIGYGQMGLFRFEGGQGWGIEWREVKCSVIYKIAVHWPVNWNPFNRVVWCPQWNHKNPIKVLSFRLNRLSHPRPLKLYLSTVHEARNDKIISGDDLRPPRCSVTRSIRFAKLEIVNHFSTTRRVSRKWAA